MHTLQKRTVVGLICCLVAAIFSALLSPVAGHCEKLRFVFMADSRGNSEEELINTTVLDDIKNQILALKTRPSFVVFGGDSVRRGYSKGKYNFQTFKDTMKPLTDAGIKLYMIMGNHELYNDSGNVDDENLGDFYIDNQRQFKLDFTDNPSNGPTNYERLVYSFESPQQDALFVVGDCYYITQDSPSFDLLGNFDFTQLAWINDQFAKTKATHKFFFVHAPYYQIAGDQARQHTTFTQLWSILDNNRVHFLACGHAHLYSRKTINSGISPNPQLSPTIQWQHNVTQQLTGTCGAQPSTDNPSVNRITWHVLNNPNTYYFSVIDIDGPIVTVTSYGGQAVPYQVIDRYNIPNNISQIRSLLLQ
jgi:hypothetical protein